MGQVGPSDLGRGEVGAAVWRAYLLAKQHCPGSGRWVQRERRGREDAEGDGDERSLSAGGSRTREAVRSSNRA